MKKLIAVAATVLALTFGGCAMNGSTINIITGTDIAKEVAGDLIDAIKPEVPVVKPPVEPNPPIVEPPIIIEPPVVPEPPVVVDPPDEGTITIEKGDYFGPTNGGLSTFYFENKMPRYPSAFLMTAKGCFNDVKVDNNGSRFEYFNASGAKVAVLKQSEVQTRGMGLILLSCKSDEAHIKY